jgi:hypothetical protein
MKISIKHLLSVVVLAIMVTACKVDNASQTSPNDSTLIKSIRKNNLENIVIPHRIDDLARMQMVQKLGFRAWELDLNYYMEDSVPVFRVKHNHDSLQAPTLEEYLRQANLNQVDKLWFDIKNLKKENFEGIALRMHQLDSIFDLKNRIIFESSNTSDILKYFREEGWQTTYYLPYLSINKWINANDTIAQMQYAESLSHQLVMQKVAAISFDVTCYPFVKEYLEDQIPAKIVYHSWDLSLKLNDPNFLKKYKEKKYSADHRIKTVLIPID